MPLPQSTHPLHSSEERVQWRAHREAMINFLASYEGQDAFLREMTENIRYYGWLTPNQERVTLRLITAHQAQAAVGTTATLRNEALADDATNIFNGDYTINDGSEHLSYKIHTVQNGPLAGKRIIKRLTTGGAYQGFAFVTTTGHVKVWRRFVNDENRNETYIVWAHLLLFILREQVTADTMATGAGTTLTLGGSVDGIRYEVQAATRCRRCNRMLTNPSSIDSGIGPDCANRDANRTTAAAPHTPITTTANTAADLVQSVEAEREADQAISVTIVNDPPTVVQPTRVPVTPEERLQAQYATDDALDDAGRLALLARLGALMAHAGAADSPNRLRFNRQYRRLSYWRRQQVCSYCGRHDFESARGCTSHTNNYCPVRREQQSRAEHEATQVQREREAAEADRIAASGPNLSALGTVIAGEVWVQ
jgi:hypothetical protein